MKKTNRNAAMPPITMVPVPISAIKTAVIVIINSCLVLEFGRSCSKGLSGHLNKILGPYNSGDAHGFTGRNRRAAFGSSRGGVPAAALDVSDLAHAIRWYRCDDRSGLPHK